MIRLTASTNDNVYYVNPTNIVCCYICNDGNTVVQFTHVNWSLHVDETPQEIADLIRNYEYDLRRR